MKVEQHFTILIYPFRHIVSGKERKARLQKLNDRWQPWWRRLNQDDLKIALDDTYFFLPYIREMLFPETARLPARDTPQQLTEALQLARLSSDQFAEKLYLDGVLRLTYDRERLKELHPLQLEFERKDAQGEIVESFSTPFHICWVDIALFPQNVGFLVLKVETDGKKLLANQINDFLYYLRLVHPPAVGWQLANWRRARADVPLIFKSRDLVDFLLQGLVNGSDHLDPTINIFLSRPPQSDSDDRYSVTEAGQVYGQVFHQYSYACLAAPPSSTDDTQTAPEAENQLSLASAKSESPLFATTIQQVLYELATCTQTTHPDYQPHPSGLKQIMEKGHIALWANWEGMALHDNVVFLGILPTYFTRNTLAHNVESDYFHLYLLTFYQKMRLSLLSGELMRHSANLHRNLREARSLWDAFVMFRNHYWFAEVTLKPQGTELYRRVQQGLDTLSLFESISDEMRELQEYYERKAERRILATTKEVQNSMNHHMEIVATVQKRVEWIEILLTSVYVAHLCDMIASHVERWKHHVPLVVGIGAVIGLVIGIVVLKPWKHGTPKKRALKKKHQEHFMVRIIKWLRRREQRRKPKKGIKNISLSSEKATLIGGDSSTSTKNHTTPS